MGGAKVAYTGLVQYFIKVDAMLYCRVVYMWSAALSSVVYIRLAGRNGEQQGRFACHGVVYGGSL